MMQGFTKRGVCLGFAGLVLCCSGLLLSGCSINIPALTIEQVVVEDASYGPFPGANVFLPLGVPVTDQEVSLGALTGLFGEEELREEVRNETSDFVANRLNIRQVLLQQVEVTASQGDFSGFEEVRFIITPQSTGEDIEIGRASSEDGFGASFVLEPDEPVDVFEITNDAGGTVDVTLIFSGTTPTENVVVDAAATITVSASFRLI